MIELATTLYSYQYIYITHLSAVNVKLKNKVAINLSNRPCFQSDLLHLDPEWILPTHGT